MSDLPNPSILLFLKQEIQCLGVELYDWRKDSGDFKKENYGGRWIARYSDGFYYHREGAPAQIFVSMYGYEERWFRNGELHREDGPAIISIEQNSFELIWKHKKEFHNWLGPARITRNWDGRIREEWFVHGDEVTEETKKWLEEQGIDWCNMDDTQRVALKMFLAC